MAIGPGADIGDDARAGGVAPLEGRRADMGQQGDIGERQQPGIDRRLMGVDVKPGAGDLKKRR